MKKREKVLHQRWTRILGVDYLHLLFEDGTGLYITRHGLPFARQLKPQNYWTDKDWLVNHSYSYWGCPR